MNAGITAGVGVTLAFLNAGCVSTPEDRPREEVVRLTSGMPGSGFHALGIALARAYAELSPHVRVELLESPGAVRNVEALQGGDAEIGFAFADVTYLAYTGALEPRQPPFERLRGVAVLQLTPLYVIARRGLEIRSVTDLRGRRVGMGPPGSGTAVTSGIVLSAFGVPLDEITTAYLPVSEASKRLEAGALDAVFVNTGYSAQSVAIATRAGGVLLAVEGPAVSRLRSEYPFLRLTFIPGGTYAGHPDTVRTVGVDMLVVCRAALDSDLVYALTRRLFEVLPKISSESMSLHRMDMEQASATPIPLHEGAARYYRERELSR